MAFGRRVGREPAEVQRTRGVFELLPRDDEFVVRFGRPDELFWTGLPALSWKAYTTSINRMNRRAAIDAARCLLVPTTERLIIMSTKGMTEMELSAIEDVEASEAPELGPDPSEVFLRVAKRLPDGQVMAFDFTAHREDAKPFADLLHTLMEARTD